MGKQKIFSRLLGGLALAGSLFMGHTQANAQQLPPATIFADNPSGTFATFSGANSSGQIDFSNPFFQPIGLQFGGNNRTCSTCHVPGDSWSITPERAQNLFNASNGLDPLFLPVDGTNAPDMNRSTLEARRIASSLLLSKGVIRISTGIPANRDFDLVAVTVPQDGTFPANFAQNVINAQRLSLYRRPPQSSNAAFFTDLMWDGRENLPNRSFFNSLVSQSINAARGHFSARIGTLTAAQRQMFVNIVNFELNLFGAQIDDLVAMGLDEAGAIGGPLPLFAPPPEFFQGGIFSLFTAWNQLPATSTDPVVQRRRSVARGEAIFNSRVFNTGGALVGQATCTTCHSNRNAGSNLAQRRFNLGISNPNLRLNGLPVNAPLPVYTLRRRSNGETIRTTDPGRIMITGRWGVGDGDSFRVPVLRGLAGRAPYFHGGQAPSLVEVVRFYNGRFNMGLNTQQQQDLLNYLRTL